MRDQKIKRKRGLTYQQKRKLADLGKGVMVAAFIIAWIAFLVYGLGNSDDSSASDNAYWTEYERQEEAVKIETRQMAAEWVRERNADFNDCDLAWEREIPQALGLPAHDFNTFPHEWLRGCYDEVRLR